MQFFRSIAVVAQAQDDLQSDSPEILGATEPQQIEEGLLAHVAGAAADAPGSGW